MNRPGPEIATQNKNLIPGFKRRHMLAIFTTLHLIACKEASDPIDTQAVNQTPASQVHITAPHAIETMRTESGTTKPHVKELHTGSIV